MTDDRCRSIATEEYARRTPMTTQGSETQGGVLPSLRLDCPCDLAAVRLASLQVREFLLARGLTEDVVAALELALVEAANNAVEHSTGEARELPIRIDATVGSHEVELRICDHTPGFDWPEEAELPDDDSEGGRGLFLIQSLVDRTSYLRARGENCLILTKAHKQATPTEAPAADSEPALKAQVVDLEHMLDGMTQELTYSYETLTSIFRYSTQLASSQDLHSFADRLLRDALAHTEADFIALRLFESERQVLRRQHTEPVVAVPMEVRVDNAASREAEAARTRQDVWFDQSHPLAAGDPLRQGGDLRIGVCHPLALNNQLLGTVTLARCGRDTPFRAAQINLLHTLADFLAIQIANDRFLQERMQTKVMRRELDIAAGIQRSLLPTRIPSAFPFSIATCCESAQDVGGDFLDVIPVDDRGVLFVIADVMGKGIPAALLAAILRSVVRSLPQRFAEPALLLSTVNRILYEDFSRVDMFATALVAYLDRLGRRLTVASAGHCPVLVVQPGEAGAHRIEASGPPLGVVAEVGYFAEIVSLARGSRALLYTDGVTELADPQGAMFTEERLVEWFVARRHAGHTAESLKNLLKAELARFQRGQPSRDDQTFILLTHDTP
jgi:serine phosphatase RsbU (regulator of sigma subunit)/anti-sigma regulatory factor (Ser/Thr protein kinase)